MIRHGFPIIDIVKEKHNKIRVISGGRFIKGKGFDLYIQAISALPEVVKNVAEFYIAGSGEEESLLRNLAKELNVRIEFLGQVHDFQNLLFQYDVFVIATSRQDEGFPTVIIEAAVAKMLLITSDFVAIRE